MRLINLASLWLLLLCASLTPFSTAYGADTHSPISNLRDPTNAKAVVPTVIYASPFRRDEPITADKILPWKAANELTEKIGGWRAYLKESRQPEAAEPTLDADKPTAKVAPTPALAPAPAPLPDTSHSGHNMH